MMATQIIFWQLHLLNATTYCQMGWCSQADNAGRTSRCANAILSCCLIRYFSTSSKTCSCIMSLNWPIAVANSTIAACVLKNGFRSRYLLTTIMMFAC